MKKIWILNHYASDMYFNKGGRHYEFAQKLIDKGYDVTIFCASTSHTHKGSIEVTGKYVLDTVDKIKFLFVPTREYNKNGFDRMINMIQFYLRMKSVGVHIGKKYGKPDIILASSVHPLTMLRGIFLSRKFEIPCICEIRDLWPEAIFKFSSLSANHILGKILMQGEHWIYAKADSLIFTKEGDIDYLRENNWTIDTNGDIDQNKIFYINNGVNLEKFYKLEKNYFFDEDLENDKKKVIYTGSLRPVNDVNKLVEVADLLRDNTEILFLIYGDGPEKDSLKKMIKKKRLTNIIIKGGVEKDNIPYILSKSSLNLLHYSEKLYDWSRGNSSNKLFEYLASGKAIVSTVKMGYSILEKYNCGLESNSNNAKDIAETILSIVIDDDLAEKLGENSKKTVKLFDYNVLTDKLEKVIYTTEGKYYDKK